MNKIGVGSTNPVKVKAATQAVNSFWSDVDIIALKVNSGVSAMPVSEQETRIGAHNRAVQVLEITNSWIGIGNEGGICYRDGQWYIFSTTCATNGETISWGGETYIKLPPQITSKLGDYTIELGDIIDTITGDTNTKQKEGAIGYLTHGRVTRTDVFRLSTQMALAPFLWE